MIATQTPAATSFQPAAFEAWLGARDEPSWVQQSRRIAWDKFTNGAWPSRSDEEWSRTDIRLFRLGEFALPGGSTPAVSSEAQASTALLLEGIQCGGSVATIDGLSGAGWIDTAWSRKGVIFGPLDQCLAEHPELLRGYLEQPLVSADTDRFAALQAACWSGGALLYVPRGLSVDSPLHVISELGPGATDLSRLVVVLEEGAEATLLTELQSRDALAPGFHCGAIELRLAAGARLRFVSLQNWNHGVWHFAHHKAVIGRDASLQWTSGALGSRLSKVNQHVALAGPGAESQVNGVMFTEGKQHLSYHTLQHHRAPHGRSDFLYKAALQDESRTVWRGMIKVDPGAMKTDGYQRNDNLILSSQARADSIPGLEIEADDVRCTHGSTSGRVDEELIFYAQSRGYTRQEAIRLVVTGFFQQVFDRVTIESVRDALGLAIARRVREYT